MIDLSWGGLTAGYIDITILAPAAGGTSAQMLEPAAAAAWARMRDACHAATGYWINPQADDGVASCYRTFASAVNAWTIYQRDGQPVAADPYGQPSNHEWARAIDITGYDQPGVWAWLQAHAAEYGFSHATGAASGEPWHWESYNAPTASASVGVVTHLVEAKDETMYLIWTTNGTGWLFIPGRGFFPLRSMQQYLLFKRVINSAQGNDRPDTFLPAELDIMNSILQSEPYHYVLEHVNATVDLTSLGKEITAAVTAAVASVATHGVDTAALIAAVNAALVPHLDAIPAAVLNAEAKRLEA